MSKKEGVVRAYQHHDNTVVGIVQVSCDTDFAARNEEFLEFADNLAMQVAYECPDSCEEFLKAPLLVNDKLTVSNYIEEQNKKFGEKISLVRYDQWKTCWDPEELGAETEEEQKIDTNV